MEGSLKTYFRRGGEIMREADCLVWRDREIRLGVNTVERFRNGNGFRIYCRANDLINQPTFIISPQEVVRRLVRTSPGKMGFTGEATRRNIYRRALELGLEICPNETGLALRYQYLDQMARERIYVGMEPILASDGSLKLFLVGRKSDGVLYLGVANGDPGALYPIDSQWAFLQEQ